LVVLVLEEEVEAEEEGRGWLYTSFSCDVSGCAFVTVPSNENCFWVFILVEQG
jgi:hypothetical protein